MLPENDKVISIDIDGTICTIEPDYSQCRLIPGAIEAIRKIKQSGYTIFLYTGRHINHFGVTTKWLIENGVPYDHIVFGKPPARYYIDDRAIQFRNWEEVLERIQL
jgi:ribonucleotide monophosphatase NagD (HAD superfamily)